MRGYFAGWPVAPPSEHTWASSRHFNQRAWLTDALRVWDAFLSYSLTLFHICFSLPELEDASQRTPLKAAAMHIHIFASKDATYGNHDSVNMNKSLGVPVVHFVQFGMQELILRCLVFVVLARVYIRVLRS